MILDKAVLIIALTIWWEARGESHEGRMAVASVIWNRSALPHGKYDLAWVVIRPKQFSCWNGKDTRNLTEPAVEGEAYEVWQDCVKIATDMCRGEFTPTTSADHYYNPNLVTPEWANNMKVVNKIENHWFLDSGRR